MTIAHPGDEEADLDQAQPLLQDPDAYSLNSFNDFDGEDVGPTPFARKRSRSHVQHRINAIFPEVQLLPLKWFEKHAHTKWRKIAALAFALGHWIALMAFLSVRASSIPAVPGYGEPRRLTCYSNAFGNIVERSAVPSCDTSNPECISFISPPFAFRCPSDCASAHLQEEHYLGDQLFDHRIWVIGGAQNDTGEAARYRADSYICGAALHAGIISDRSGGCGVLTLHTGEDNFVGSNANGVQSLDFASSFPLSFTVAKTEEANSSRCYDMIWTPFTVSVILTIGISLLTSSASVFFCSVYTIVFFQTALITDAPNSEDYSQVVQVAFGRFLPAAFVGFAIYKFCAKHTLSGLDAHIEKTILWVGGCWLGSVDNYTLDRLPLSRLTPRDLAEPGAIIVLLCVVGAIITAAGTQAWAFWKDGRFWKYLAIYGIMGLSIIILVLIPGLNLRIHHYILALLLLPGTAIQTRPSLLFQGFLIGLFINGVARWGFASILETTRFLAREGQLGSDVPKFLGPIITNATHISFEFPSLAEGWDGISVMVNDVERTRIGRSLSQTVFEWTKSRTEDLFFRFAYVKMGYVDGDLIGDYTRPGTWSSNGTWTVVEAG